MQNNLVNGNTNLSFLNTPAGKVTKVVAGAAAVFAPAISQAAIISDSGMHQELTFNTDIQNLGGMQGVDITATIDEAIPGGVKDVLNISSDGGLVTRTNAEGTLIGSGDFFGPSSSKLLLSENGADASVQFTGTQFFGVQFDNGNGFQYGWVEIFGEQIASADDRVYLEGYGYSDVVGEEIRTGQTEPSSTVSAPASLSLLALGAAGLVGFRRRKVKAQK